MGAFVITPLPPVLAETSEQQGPFAPRALPRFVATTDPSATLSSSADFPGAPVIRPTCLRRFRGGTRRASPVARRVLVTVPSLTTPPEGPAASASLRRAMLPSPSSSRARPPGLTHFRGHLAFTFVTARRLAHPPFDGFVDGLQDVLVSLRPAIRATGLLALTPAGLTPAEHISLLWTHGFEPVIDSRSRFRQ